MAFVLNTTGLLLCWLGCYAVYLSSEHQPLVTDKIPKRLSWICFGACNLLAFLILLSIHHWLAALLVLLTNVMTIWVLLALVAPYFPKSKIVWVYGTLTTVFLGVVGGFYVY